MEGEGEPAEEGTQEAAPEEEEPAPKKARAEGAEEAPPAEAMGGEQEEQEEQEQEAEESFPYPETQPSLPATQPPQEQQVAPEGEKETPAPAAAAAAEEEEEEEEQEGGTGSPKKAAPATEGAATPAAPAPAPTQQRGEAAVEAGRVHFLYRPRVGVEEAAGLADVQRFYMVLTPEGAGKKARLAVIGKKRLPAVEKHEVGGCAAAYPFMRPPPAAPLSVSMTASLRYRLTHSLTSPCPLPPPRSASSASSRRCPRTWGSCWRGWGSAATRPRPGGRAPWPRRARWARAATALSSTRGAPTSPTSECTLRGRAALQRWSLGMGSAAAVMSSDGSMLFPESESVGAPGGAGWRCLPSPGRCSPSLSWGRRGPTSSPSR